MAVGGSASLLDTHQKNPHDGRNRMEHRISENSDSDGQNGVNNKPGLSPDRINSNLRSLDHDLLLQKTPDSFTGEFGVQDSYNTAKPELTLNVSA